MLPFDNEAPPNEKSLQHQALKYHEIKDLVGIFAAANSFLLITPPPQPLICKCCGKVTNERRNGKNNEYNCVFVRLRIY